MDNYYKMSYGDVFRILSLLKELYSCKNNEPLFDEEDLRIILDMQIAHDNWETVMSYTE